MEIDNKNLNRTQIEDLKAIENIQQKMNIYFVNTKKLFFDKDNNLISKNILNEYIDKNGNLITHTKCVQMGKINSIVKTNDNGTLTIYDNKITNNETVNIIKDIIDSSQKLKRYNIYIYEGSTSDDFYFCVI